MAGPQASEGGPDAPPPAFLIDASCYVFRAWFALPAAMTGPDGSPVNAVYGFAGFLGEFLQTLRPRHVAAAFDQRMAGCFRTALYPAYKANSEPAPPELRRQFDQCRAVTEALGIDAYVDPGFEADDFIGTLASDARGAGLGVSIVSRDKDLLQLLTPGDRLWDYGGLRSVDHAGVIDALGVRAEQVPDFLGLAGDGVDNIPGVPGIGAKTAAALLGSFDDLDALFAGLGRIPRLPIRGAGRIAALLDAHREQALLSRELARICCDAPVKPRPAALTRRAPDLDGLGRLYDALGFGSALRRQAERIAADFAAAA